MLPHHVTVRRSDFRIRVFDIFRASNQPRKELAKIKQEFSRSYVTVDNFNYRGTYVDFWVGVELCRRYGLTELEKELRSWRVVLPEPAQRPERSEAERSEAELSDFIEITGFSNPVMARRLDFRINAVHIIKLAGYSRHTLANFRNSLSSEVYEILWGSTKHRGTYVDFDVGIELCRLYGLYQLEQRLYDVKSTSEGLAVEVDASHVGPAGQTFRLLPESPGSDTVPARKESTPSSGIWSQDQPPTSPGGLNTDESMQAEDAREMDSGSAGSEGSVTSRESYSIQRQPQPVPSIRGAEDAASSRHPEHDTWHPLTELAGPHSPSAQSVQYEVWDSQPQRSELTEVKPDLKPSSWKTASHYGSFSDLFAPI